MIAAVTRMALAKSSLWLIWFNKIGHMIPPTDAPLMLMMRKGRLRTEVPGTYRYGDTCRHCSTSFKMVGDYADRR